MQQNLNSDVASHKKTVSSVCDTGDSVLIALKEDEQESMKEELDKVKERYQEVSHQTSTRQSHLVEALVLSQQFRDIHKEVETLLDRCEDNFLKLDDESQPAEVQQEIIKVKKQWHFSTVSLIILSFPCLVGGPLQKSSSARERCEE